VPPGIAIVGFAIKYQPLPIIQTPTAVEAIFIDDLVQVAALLHALLFLRRLHLQVDANRHMMIGALGFDLG
jgi:hypothetical protein